LENFCADEAIDMWMEECPTNRRPHQSARNPYRPCKKKSSLEATDDSKNEKLMGCMVL